MWNVEFFADSAVLYNLFYNLAFLLYYVLLALSMYFVLVFFSSFLHEPSWH